MKHDLLQVASHRKNKDSCNIYYLKDSELLVSHLLKYSLQKYQGDQSLVLS